MLRIARLTRFIALHAVRFRQLFSVRYRITLAPCADATQHFLPAEAVARLFDTVNPLPNVAPSWKVAPMQSAMVVRRHPEARERHLDLLKWGLLPSWTKGPAKTPTPHQCRDGDRRNVGPVPRCLQGSPLDRAGGRVLRVEGNRDW